MMNETAEGCKCQCDTTVCGMGNFYYYNCGGLVPSIGENGNWFIGGRDTGVSASGAGKDGKSAYEAAVEHGFTGTEEEWIASLKGADGVPGAAGPQGETGPQGPAGPQGPKGEAGTALRYDVLFEGNANTIGGSYPLSKPVTGYRLVAIFCAGHKKENSTFVQRNGVVIAGDEIKLMEHSTGWSVLFQDQATIGGTFTDSMTVKIKKAELGNHALNQYWDYIAITKIIGIY